MVGWWLGLCAGRAAYNEFLSGLYKQHATAWFTPGEVFQASLELVMLILLKVWSLIRDFCLIPIYSFCAALVWLCCCRVYTTYHGSFKSAQGTRTCTYSLGSCQFQTFLNHFKPLKWSECFLALIERQWFIPTFHHHLQEVWKFCISKEFYCRIYMIIYSMDLLKSNCDTCKL